MSFSIRNSCQSKCLTAKTLPSQGKIEGQLRKGQSQNQFLLIDQCSRHQIEKDLICLKSDKMVCSHCVIFQNQPGKPSDLLPLKDLKKCNETSMKKGKDIIQFIQNELPSLIKSAKKQAQSQIETTKNSSFKGIKLLFQRLYSQIEVQEKKAYEQIAQECKRQLSAAMDALNLLNNEYNQKYEILKFDKETIEINQAIEMHKHFLKNKKVIESLDDRTCVEKIISKTKQDVDRQTSQISINCGQFTLIKKMNNVPPLFGLQNKRPRKQKSRCNSIGPDTINFEIGKVKSQKRETSSSTKLNPKIKQRGHIKGETERKDKSFLMDRSNLNTPQLTERKSSICPRHERNSSLCSNINAINSSKMATEQNQPLSTLQEFVRNPHLETLELSNSNKQNLYDILHKARKERTIPRVKLNRVSLTDSELELIVPYLDSTESLNLSCNCLSVKAFSIILQNITKLTQLNAINLCRNKLIVDRRKSKKWGLC